MEKGFHSSCGFAMIGLLFCVLYAQPTFDDADVPTIEYAKTKDHREVYWIEDHRHRIVRIRVQFDTGVGDCASLVQKSWNEHHKVMNQKLLHMGGYARFWMGDNSAFVELSVFETYEKKALRWIRSFIKHPQNQEKRSQKIHLQQDVVTNLLYEKEEPHRERDCSDRYKEWKKGQTPLFLFSGSTNMQSVLPFLNFFWPESLTSKHRYASNKRKKREIAQYSIVDHDLGSQVELYALVPLPTIYTEVLGVYQNILSGFGGRLMMRLREEKGWVYDVSTKIHYGDRLMLEISAQCNIEDLLSVRDELDSVLQGMRQITHAELERYRWSKIKQRREDLLQGMPYLVSNIHSKRRSIVSKEQIEDLAKKIHIKDALWILVGRQSVITEIWSADWSRVSLQDR